MSTLRLRNSARESGGGPAGVPKPLFWGKTTNNPVFVPRSGLDRSASQFQVSGSEFLLPSLRFCGRGGRKNPLILVNVMRFVEPGVVRNGSNTVQSRPFAPPRVASRSYNLIRAVP